MLAAACALASSSCAVNGLSFTEDDRVSISHPKAGETVTLPFELAWSAKGVNQRFAVFFNSAPMRPGRDLRSLVSEQDPCRNDPACPTPQWLEGRSVFVTSEPRLRVAALPDRRSNNRSRDRHEASIVLVDEAGRRVGESSFVTEFVVERGGK